MLYNDKARGWRKKKKAKLHTYSRGNKRETKKEGNGPLGRRTLFQHSKRGGLGLTTYGTQRKRGKERGRR